MAPPWRHPEFLRLGSCSLCGNRPARQLSSRLYRYLPAYTDRIGFWTIGGDGLRWFGLALFAAGGVMRIWPVFVPGKRFSGLVAIQPGHVLVTSGIYGTIRYPSYLGLLANMLD